MLYVIENLHWFILLIGVLVFVHELGHFVVAKACGVKVLCFSLGFGPKIVALRRGETEYRVSALPLGGYVKMLGEGPGAMVAPEEQHRAFMHKPVWQRAAIALAGPLFNIVLAFAVYLFMAHGTQTFGDTKLGIVSRDGAAWAAGLRPGDRIVSVAGEPVSEWNELREAIGSRPAKTFPLSFERDGQVHTVSITPKAADEKDLFEQPVTRGRIGVSLGFVKPVLAVIDPESPAALAGLKTDDLIVEVNGQKVAAWHELRSAVKGTPVNESVEIVARRGDQPLQLSLRPAAPLPDLDPTLFSAADTGFGYTGLVNKDTVIHQVQQNTPAELAGLQKGDRLLHLAITKPNGETIERPIDVWQIDFEGVSGVDARSDFALSVQRGREVLTRSYKLEEREEKDELKNVRKVLVFGASHDGSVLGTYQFERDLGVGEALVMAAISTARDATVISRGLGLIVRGRVSLDNMGGPIMLFVIAEKSAKLGWEFFLSRMALISVNLGLLNLLPVPILDGGHLMFFAIEAIRRRPPSLRTREIANLVGFAILLMLMVLVFKNDILRYVLG